MMLNISDIIESTTEAMRNVPDAIGKELTRDPQKLDIGLTLFGIFLVTMLIMRCLLYFWIIIDDADANAVQ